jgi:ABC-type enterochelin transport system substrate-binding protein
MKQKTKQTIKNLKKSLINIKNEWNKAMKELEKFDPTVDMDLGTKELENQFKDFRFDTGVKI